MVPECLVHTILKGMLKMSQLAECQCDHNFLVILKIIKQNCTFYLYILEYKIVLHNKRYQKENV